MASDRSTKTQNRVEDTREIDLGTVLAYGQTLKHEFRLTNTTKRPIRLAGAVALTPCCSSVGSVATSIPPGGEAILPVFFSPGFQSGRKGVRFLVRTDDGEEPTRFFSLVADLAAEVEVAVTDGKGLSLPMGKPGMQAFRVIGRRTKMEGRRAPTTVVSASPLTARFRGEAIERTS